MNLKEMFTDFGALGYSNEQIGKVLGTSVAETEAAIKKHTGDYEIGQARFKYSVDKKLMEMALGGDMKAIQKIERMQNK